MNKRIFFVVMSIIGMLAISFGVLPVHGDTWNFESSGVSTTQTAVTSNLNAEPKYVNATLGSTTPIQSRSTIEKLDYILPNDFVNASEISDEQHLIIPFQNEDSSLDELNETRVSSSYTLELTPGEYFPDVSVARVTKNMWIDNPYSSQTSCDLTFI
ncbi:MAG: hypothetical protein ACTSPB_13615, partial [Candidatus Thorarchaeota archaeon]